MEKDYWYRCEVAHYSVADEWGDHSYTTTKVVWTSYEVHKTTAKGVFLLYLFTPVFVRGKSKKQLACPTKELALQDAIVRKQYHIAGCQARLAAAHNDLRLLEFERGLL